MNGGRKGWDRTGQDGGQTGEVRTTAFSPTMLSAQVISRGFGEGLKWRDMVRVGLTPREGGERLFMQVANPHVRFLVRSQKRGALRTELLITTP